MTLLTLRDPFLATPFRLMDEWMRGWSGGGRVTGFAPPLDVRETDEAYLVMLDLPGVKAEDVSIEVSDRELTISGSRVPVETGEAQLVERPFGSFVRTLTLPKGIDEDRIAADFEDGVLTLRIPKPEDQRPKKIAISAGDQKAITK
jgi:HSP20 family protein